MSSLRRHEGWLLIDNRASGGAMLESATVTCSHCHAVVVLNPGRSRPREYCPGCDHYICDGCAATRQQTLTCVPLTKVFDQLQSEILRAENAHKGTIYLPTPFTAEN